MSAQPRSREFTLESDNLGLWANAKGQEPEGSYYSHSASGAAVSPPSWPTVLRSTAEAASLVRQAAPSRTTEESHTLAAGLGSPEQSDLEIFPPPNACR